MPIRAGACEQHTFRVTGQVGAIKFGGDEFNGTLSDARSKASQFEQRGDTDGMFGRGRARIEMWNGSRYVEVDRYQR